jgi:hypothetical protein
VGAQGGRARGFGTGARRPRVPRRRRRRSRRRAGGRAARRAAPALPGSAAGEFSAPRPAPPACPLAFSAPARSPGAQEARALAVCLNLIPATLISQPAASGRGTLISGVGAATPLQLCGDPGPSAAARLALRFGNGGSLGTASLPQRAAGGWGR